MTVLHALGDVGNPMSRLQVHQKFRRITAQVLLPEKQDALMTALDGLLVDGFKPLFAALDGN
jgi:2-methylcitrate dehydratase PrpD